MTSTTIRFAQKGHTGDETWVYGYNVQNPKPNHSNGSSQKSQDRKKHAKLGQM